MSTIQQTIKRILDIIISLVTIIILIPIFIIISICIKFTSNGPVFFRQERIGKYGDTFRIFKFRTMVNNAEKIGDGLSVKSENDFRITKMGYFLRKTSLDEIPQLFNILIGEMSLVGPRPPVTYHPYNGFKNYPDWTKKRFSVKPGVTGLAQVKVRNSVSWEERIKLDIKYIENYSFMSDLKIIFQTILRVIKTENIYD